MSTLWVVCEAGWEYNDEIYSKPESGGGRPMKAFKREEDAVTEVDRLTIQALQKMDLVQYCYDLQDIISQEGIDLLIEWGVIDDPDEREEFSRVLTEEECTALLPHLEFGEFGDLYEVYEIEGV